MTTKIEHRKVRAWANIEKIGEVDVTDLQITYALNQVPSGSITLALGRNSVTGAVSNVQGKMSEFTSKLKVQVYLKIGSEENMIFDGFSAGAPYQRNYDSSSFSVGLIGWLDDLMNSSALSKLFAVGTPSDFFQPAVADIDGVTIYTPTGAGEALVQQNVSSDLWNTARMALITLCKTALLDIPGQEAAATAGGEVRPRDATDNSVAIDILENRFTGDDLEMVVQDTTMKDSVALHVGDLVFRPVQGDTIWSKIMALADLYAFAIVPMVATARAVAWLPFVKPDSVSQQITADEYESITPTVFSKTQLRGAVLLGSLWCMDGAINNQAKEQSQVAARYIVGEVGQIIAETAPAWLTGEMSSEAWTPETTGQGGQGVRATGKVSEGGAPPKGVNETYSEMMKAETVGQKYAQYIFLTNYLNGRTATIVGKLRLDICPGTPVKIEVGGADLYGEQFIYGNVRSVTIMAETRSPSASTVFNIDHYYMEKEAALAAETHPLYSDVFKGASLV